MRYADRGELLYRKSEMTIACYKWFVVGIIVGAAIALLGVLAGS